MKRRHENGNTNGLNQHSGRIDVVEMSLDKTKVMTISGTKKSDNKSNNSIIETDYLEKQKPQNESKTTLSSYFDIFV